MFTEKENKLVALLQDLGSVAVAFSGGVDSTYLLRIALAALGEKVTALTVNTPYIPDHELKEASETAEKWGLAHIFFDIAIDESIKSNPTNRCYLCKSLLFSRMKEYTLKNSLGTVSDGTNLDDIGFSE